MSTKSNHWILAITTTLIVALSMLLSLSASASAAPASDSVSNSCLSCHEDLYYLHDMGKYYCLTMHTDHCVDCHEGDPSALDEVASHRGLIASPQENNGQKCSQCHPQDVQTRLDTFASMAGYEPVIQASTYVPAAETTSEFPAVSESDGLLQILPWLAGAMVFFGVWLVLVLSSPQRP